jgi:hypothetical protein
MEKTTDMFCIKSLQKLANFQVLPFEQVINELPSTHYNGKMFDQDINLCNLNNAFPTGLHFTPESFNFPSP